MATIIGITGTAESGKSELKDILKKKFSSYYVTLSDVIRAEFERKKKDFGRKTLQDIGNEMRQKYGTHILAKMAVEYLPKNKELIIVDGIRNPGEVDWLRKTFGKDFFLIAIDAPREIRWERAQKRESYKIDPKTYEEFAELDDRDQGLNEPVYGQHVKECMERADFKIVNDKDLKDLERQVDEILQNLK